MSQSRKQFSSNDLTGDILVTVNTGEFSLTSSLKDLPTDILEKVASEASTILLERDDNWLNFAENDQFLDDDYLIDTDHLDTSEYDEFKETDDEDKEQS